MFDENEDDIITITVKHNGIELPIDAMGTSALQIVQILSYVFYFQPKLIILDEPDTHLHPNNQRRMMRELIRLSHEKELQVILSTHSRHILDESEDEGKVIWLSNGKIQDSEFKYTQLLMELGALDKTDFLNNPNISVVVCTEDEEHLKMLPCILKASGFDMSKTVVIPYYGCGKIDNARLLADFLSKYAPNKTMIIHRDRDYLDKEEIEKIEKSLTTDKVKVFFTSGTDIESIFINAEHITFLYPDISIEDVTSFIDDARDEAKDTSIEKYINYVVSKNKSRNAGEISRECNKSYNESPLKYTYGKKALGLLKSKIQQRIARNPDLFQVSEYIKQTTLMKLAELSRSV